MDTINPQGLEQSNKQPETKHLHIFLILLVGVIMLLIGLGAGYILFANKTASLQTSTSAESKTSPEVLPTQVVEPTIQEVTKDAATGWNIYHDPQGIYSFEYPPSWVINQQDNILQNEVSKIDSNGKITNKDDLIGLSIINRTADYLHGAAYKQMTEAQFYDTNYNFWQSGTGLGGGPGLTISKPVVTTIGGKKAIMQTSHWTTNYEWSKVTDMNVTYSIYGYDKEANVTEIFYTYNDANPQKVQLLDTMNKVLSTLKFEKT